MNRQQKKAVRGLGDLAMVMAKGVDRSVVAISRANRKRKIAAKHEAIIARFREDCIALGIEVD